MKKEEILQKVTLKLKKYSELSYKAECQAVEIIYQMKQVNKRLIEDDTISIAYINTKRIIESIHSEDLYSISVVGKLFSTVHGVKKMNNVEKAIIGLKLTLEKAIETRNRMIELVEDLSYDPEMDELLDMINSLKINETISLRLLELRLNELMS